MYVTYCRSDIFCNPSAFRNENSLPNLSGIPEEERSLSKRRRRWVVDVEMGLREMKYEDMTGLNQLIMEFTDDFLRKPYWGLFFVKRGEFLYQLSNCQIFKHSAIKPVQILERKVVCRFCSAVCTGLHVESNSPHHPVRYHVSEPLAWMQSARNSGIRTGSISNFVYCR